MSSRFERIRAGALRVTALSLFAALLWTPRAVAENALADELPAELLGVGLEDRVGAQLPLDVVLTNQNGERHALADYLSDGRPLVLTLAWYRCPMLCSLMLNGMVDGLRDLDWSAGREFDSLVVSIDPREDARLAKEKRANYLREYGRVLDGDPTKAPRGFDFAVGAESEVRRLAQAVGFGYRFDEQSQQFAHAAAIFIITPDGRLSRVLPGVAYRGSDLRLALVEASRGALGSTWDRLLLFCFHYDPEARGYVLGAQRLMRAGGVVSMIAIGFFLWGLSRRGRQGSARTASGRGEAP